ncbi:MAG TPA: adenylate/guanylate cyclase domain-containing protein, partial [Nonomuraea sp.]|nr:adenylate/guanylate cyclase domain-containing protein [Nonomuraea sp.]
AAGVIVWLRRPDYRTGKLMVLAGYLTCVGGLQRVPESGALFAIGNCLSGLQEVALGYMLLTYPSGRPGPNVAGRLARGIAVFGPALALGDLLTRQNGTPPCFAGVCSDEPNPFLIVDLGTFFAQVTTYVLAVMGAVTLIVVAWRFFSAHGATRRALAPMLLAGVIGAAGVTLRGLVAGDVAVAYLARGLQFLVPLALGIGFMRSRMARAAVADLVIGSGPTSTVHDLEAGIRRALHDPSARLLRWSPGAATYVDAEDNPADVTADTRRQLTVIGTTERPLAVVEHDPVLSEEGDLLRSVIGATHILLENNRLADSLHAQVAEAHLLPAGRMTLLFSDIEGSTELLDGLGERYVDILREVRQLQRQAVREAGGVEVDSRGDEFFAVVPEAPAAVRAAVSVQQRLATHPWPGGVHVRIRIGLHTGTPERTPEGYVGMDVHVAARVMATGHGGQVIISADTWTALDGRTDGVDLVELGAYRLKGVPNAIRLFQVSRAGTAATFPPIRAELAPVP